MALGLAVGSVLVLILGTLVAMGLFSQKNHMPVDGKTILMTGASEGLGLSAACKLAAKGASIVIVSRDPVKLSTALSQISAAARDPTSQRFHSISADVAQEGYAEPLFAEVVAWNAGNPPDIVWCVAGVSYPGLFVESPLSVTRKSFDINFYGMAELAHATLKVWLAPDAPVTPEPRHFVFTTSVAAFVSIAGYGTYSPSKFAVRALADALTQEVLLYPQNVEIHMFAPSTMATPGNVRENLTKPEITHILEKDDPRWTADEGADIGIKGLENGEYLIVAGLQPQAMKWSSLTGSVRNNWVVDTIASMIMPLIWCAVLPMMMGTIRKFARENGHPSTYAKKHE
jgi:3-dehydrosphinganine reductase